MKLVMFDIDGTLVDSMKSETLYFTKSLKEVLKIEGVNTDWSSYKHTTDIGILSEIVWNEKNREITSQEIQQFIKVFNTYLFESDTSSPLLEIKGALKFFEALQNNNSYGISFATGGFKELALVKLAKIGINPKDFPFSCSHNGISREHIMKDAEKKALDYYKKESFDEIIYFGDAIWDYKACKNLGYNFIAVNKNREKFKNLSVAHIIENYQEIFDLFMLNEL